METTRISFFNGKQIRKVIYQNEWWFAVSDAISVLTDASDTADYLKKMRLRDEQLSQGWGQIVTPLYIKTIGGRQQLNCANAEGIFRIVQSIPSPKAEPFKRWLAKVGYERVQEIEDPELLNKRARMVYKLKGYTDNWIDNRIRGIAIRDELIDEWQKRGVKEAVDYKILTSEISKATFGVTPDEYKRLKGLKRENLRDHMNDFELIFNMLGERSTTEIHQSEDSQGLPKLKSDAEFGGSIAGNARKELEKRLGRTIIYKKNYLKNKKRP